MTDTELEAEKLLETYTRLHTLNIVNGDKTYQAELCENDLKIETQYAANIESSKQMRWTGFKLKKTDMYPDYLCEIIAFNEPQTFSVRQNNEWVLNFSFGAYRLSCCKIEDCSVLGTRLMCYGIEELTFINYTNSLSVGTFSPKKSVTPNPLQYMNMNTAMYKVAKPQGYFHVKY